MRFHSASLHCCRPLSYLLHAHDVVCKDCSESCLLHVSLPLASQVCAGACRQVTDWRNRNAVHNFPLEQPMSSDEVAPSLVQPCHWEMGIPTCLKSKRSPRPPCFSAARSTTAVIPDKEMGAGASTFTFKYPLIAYVLPPPFSPPSSFTTTMFRVKGVFWRPLLNGFELESRRKMPHSADCRAFSSSPETDPYQKILLA